MARRLIPIAGVLSLLGCGSALASDSCDYYRYNRPDLFEAYCSRGGGGNSKPAGSNSTFSDGFNLNSASLPTEPSSFGLETIGNYLRDGSGTFGPTFSLIKGFHKFGTGISTSGNNTFYGNDIVQRATGPSDVTSFAPRETAVGNGVNLNLGTSIRIFDASGDLPGLRLGLSLRYNKITNSIGGGPGVMLNWSNLTLGAGFTRERVSNYLGQITFRTFMASTRLWIFEFEYNYLDNQGGYSLMPIQILSVTTSVKRLLITTAARVAEYRQEGVVLQKHLAVQYLFSPKFSAGFLYNYIPGASSLGMQFFL